MTFLIDLFRWFVYGSSEVSVPTAAVETSSQPDVEERAKPFSLPKKTGYIDFDLNKGANVSQFLDDIRSIEPLSKQFSRAREELLAELKKLTPNRKN